MGGIDDIIEVAVIEQTAETIVANEAIAATEVVSENIGLKEVTLTEIQQAYLDEIPKSETALRDLRIAEINDSNAESVVNPAQCDYLRELNYEPAEWNNLSFTQQKGVLSAIQSRLTSLELDINSAEFKASFSEEIQNKVVEQTEKVKDITTIHTRNEALEGKLHPETGVRFERKIIELDSGKKIEGVFPQFESFFETQLSKDYYLESDVKQFEECGKQLKQKFIEDSEFRKQFSERAQDDIMNDRTPPYGYTWHHTENPGKMQLVEYETHAKTGHTGGKVVWGGGNENR